MLFTPGAQTTTENKTAVNICYSLYPCVPQVKIGGDQLLYNNIPGLEAPNVFQQAK
jgi:hypothetical protein